MASLVASLGGTLVKGLPWSGDEFIYLLPSPVGDLTPAGLTPPAQSPFSQESLGLARKRGLGAYVFLSGPHAQPQAPGH